MFTFLRDYQLFSKVFATIIFSLAMYEHANFLTFLPILIFHFYCYYYDDNHPSGCEVVSHCSLDLHFPKDNDVDHLSLYLLAISISLEKCLFNLFPTFKLDHLMFPLWSYKSYLYSLLQCGFFLFHVLLVIFYTLHFHLILSGLEFIIFWVKDCYWMNRAILVFTFVSAQSLF